ncbi:hypothetical protein OQH60_06270 [Campylobacter sp. MIT 21-1685]|uniref:hypothetical protein n=1 Tax=unclassified Campylobacter TaxID=2593542 RepID=UPI00224AEDFD|nr:MULTISPECIES: hypothetical protein [unclassified Campylobacter]MCX2683428.1 hypothetical protein [Campylobacter sp. MIT 21-1684]MCX2751751.1 hypothetical protein [Campylobacter sp. MIT 21-1682]MCX2807952.1 hypothetical protein [Campylobacter sp. MIT 21-1685]
MQTNLTQEQTDIITPFKKQKAHLQDNVSKIEINMFIRGNYPKRSGNEISDFIDNPNLLNVAI